MPRSRTTLVLLCAAVLAVGLAAGCKKQSAEVTSAWPVANSERTVSAPPKPLVYPFTGEKASKKADLVRRPISVKIENSPAARPQTGLNSADVVYETISEGGITRFNAIFQSKIPSRIGPVRSARLSDLWVVPQYRALFFFSGASSTVNHAVNGQKLPNLSEDAGVTKPYSRSSARPAPHNLYMDGTKAYPTAKLRGYSLVADLVPLQFEKRSLPATGGISEITIPFSQANTVRWVYDSDSREYERYNNGRAHTDEATGKQISADNVVVLWADYEVASHDKVGSTTYRIKLGGTGKASVFHDGQKFDGTWTADAKTPPTFKAADGTTIRLAKGRTWFQVIPLNGRITMK